MYKLWAVKVLCELNVEYLAVSFVHSPCLSWTFCAPQKINCKCCKPITTFLLSWLHIDEFLEFFWWWFMKNFFNHCYLEIFTWRGGLLYNCKAVIVTRSWILLGCEWHCKTWWYYSAKFFVLCCNSKSLQSYGGTFDLCCIFFNTTSCSKQNTPFFFFFRGTYFDSFVLHHIQYWHLYSMNSFASILASKHIPEWQWAEQEDVCITVNWRSVT